MLVRSAEQEIAKKIKLGKSIQRKRRQP